MNASRKPAGGAGRIPSDTSDTAVTSMRRLLRRLLSVFKDPAPRTTPGCQAGTRYRPHGGPVSEYQLQDGLGLPLAKPEWLCEAHAEHLGGDW